MKTTAGNLRCSQIYDPEKLRRSLLSRHPLCSAVDPYRGEKPTVFKSVQYRSASEAKYALLDHKTGIGLEYEVVKTWGATGRGYKPDFYAPRLDILIEVADFRGRFTEQKVENCKKAAEHLGLPVLLAQGFPGPQAKDPLREICRVFLPGGIESGTDPGLLKAAYPHLTQFFDVFRENDMRDCLRSVISTTFENLDEATGEPRLESWAGFIRSNMDAVEALNTASPEVQRLLFLLTTGYRERRVAEIAADLNCTELQAAKAMKYLADQQLVHKLASGYEDEWRSLDLDQFKAESTKF